jgi:hypothetical protein
VCVGEHDVLVLIVANPVVATFRFGKRAGRTTQYASGSLFAARGNAGLAGFLIGTFLGHQFVLVSDVDPVRDK